MKPTWRRTSQRGGNLNLDFERERLDDERRSGVEGNNGPGDDGSGDDLRVALLDVFEVLLGIMNRRRRRNA